MILKFALGQCGFLPSQVYVKVVKRWRELVGRFYCGMLYGIVANKTRMESKQASLG